jgi:hypothetical protein
MGLPISRVLFSIASGFTGCPFFPGGAALVIIYLGPAVAGWARAAYPELKGGGPPPPRGFVPAWPCSG